MKRLLFGLIAACALLFGFSYARAQEYSWAVHVFQVLDAEVKYLSRVVSPVSGYLKAAVLGVSEVDMRNGGGTAVGVYGAASAKNSGTTGQREIVGVYGRVDKQGQVAGIAVHGECWDTTPAGVGGNCIVLNGEMQSTPEGGEYIVLNLQSKPETRNVVGIQIQDTAYEKFPEGVTNYSRVTKFPSGWHSFGFVDGVEFCSRFTGRTQRWQYVRGAPKCDSPQAIVVQEIDLNWRPGAPLANR